MKINKILSIVIVLAMVGGFSSCKKKGCTDPNSLAFNPEAKKDDGSCTNPSSVKKALVFKKTATWCPYCGDWGATYSTNIMTDYSDCQVIQLHGDSDFETTVGDAIMDALPSAGWPHFYLGTTDISSNSYSELSSGVSAEVGASVEVAMAMEHSTSGTAMNIRVQSQWTGSSSGEYFLAVYILEDGQVAEQDIAGQPSDPNWVHNHVLRAEASSAAFGKAVTVNGDGNLEEFDVTLGGSWVAANCYPVAVMWKKNGSDYDFVNFVK
jgi:hypothetical protein